MEISDNNKSAATQQSQSTPNSAAQLLAGSKGGSTAAESFMALFSQIINGSMVTLDFLQPLPQAAAPTAAPTQAATPTPEQAPHSLPGEHRPKVTQKEKEAPVEQETKHSKHEAKEQQEEVATPQAEIVKQEVVSNQAADANAAAQAAPVEQVAAKEAVVAPTTTQTQQQATTDPKASQLLMLQQSQPVQEQAVQQTVAARAKVEFAKATEAAVVQTQVTEATPVEAATASATAKAQNVKAANASQVILNPLDKTPMQAQPSQLAKETAPTALNVTPQVNVQAALSTPRVNAEDVAKLMRNLQFGGAQNNGVSEIGGKSGLFSGQNNSNTFDLGNLGNGNAATKRAGAGRHAAGAEALPEQSQAQIIDKIQKMIETAAKTRFGTTMVVRLDPPELGAMTVKITQRSDQLFARITPDNPDVEAMLRGRVGEISQILSNTGLKAENIHLSIGSDAADVDFSSFNSFMGSQDAPAGRQGGNGSSSSHLPMGAELAAAELAAKELEAGWVA